MELMLAIGTTAGTAAAGTAAVGTAAAGSTLLSIMQGGMTAFSVMATVGQGIAANKEAKGQAKLEVAQARSDRMEGRDRASAIREELAQILGEQRVAYAAGGVRVTSGSPALLAQTSRSRAEADVQAVMSNAEITASGRLANAAMLRRRGKAALAQALIRGLQTGSDFAMDLRERG